MKIKILTDKNINEFTNKINNFLSDGWIVQGGVCYNDGVFCIALIKQ